MISVITPSLNMLEHLRNCHASLNAQPDVETEHIVVDAVSEDGTIAWAEQQSGLKCISEPDKGMYDALNKGLKQARGDIICYLNCDEQYLPNALSRVQNYFDQHPSVSVIFGNGIIVDHHFQPLYYHKSIHPRKCYIQHDYLYLMSCTMFFRKQLLTDGHFFDPSFKVAGDADFVLRLLKKGYKAAAVPFYISSFMITGNNLGADPRSLQEQRSLSGIPDPFYRPFKKLMRWLRYIEQGLKGCYSYNGPASISLFTHEGVKKVCMSGAKPFRKKMKPT